MSNNPFEAPKADTLADAFPNVDPAIIDDILASANDNLEEAFDMMLKLSDPTAQTSTDQTPPQPRPPLPERRRPPQVYLLDLAYYQPIVTLFTIANTYRI